MYDRDRKLAAEVMLHAPDCPQDPDRDPYIGCRCGATQRAADQRKAGEWAAAVLRWTGNPPELGHEQRAMLLKAFGGRLTATQIDVLKALLALAIREDRARDETE